MRVRAGNLSLINEIMFRILNQEGQWMTNKATVRFDQDVEILSVADINKLEEKRQKLLYEYNTLDTMLKYMDIEDTTRVLEKQEAVVQKLLGIRYKLAILN